MGQECATLTPEQIVRLEALKIVSSMPKMQTKDVVEQTKEFEEYVLGPPPKKKPGRPPKNGS